MGCGVCGRRHQRGTSLPWEPSRDELVDLATVLHGCLRPALDGTPPKWSWTANGSSVHLDKLRLGPSERSDLSSTAIDMIRWQPRHTTRSAIDMHTPIALLGTDFDALQQSLLKLSTDEVKIQIVHSAVGGISESDVNLAIASKAVIIGFNVRPNAKARELIERQKVRMKYFDVIYHLTDDVAKEMAGIWGPERIEHVAGRAEVKDVFTSGKRDKAAGLLVMEGSIKKGLFARLTRDDVIVSATTIQSLRRFKDEVREVANGLECGMAFENYQDVQVGDQIECFEIEEIARQL